MAKLTIDELTTPVTRQETQAKVYQVLAALGVNTTAWKSGSVVRTMIVALSLVFSAFSALMANIARSGFLELSSGSWLTLVAHYVYGVERIEADFADGVLTINNAGGGIYSLAAGDLIVANTATGLTYRSTAAVLIPALTSGVTVGIEAIDAGSPSSADALQITQVVTPPLNGVTVSNLSPLIGVDTESDVALRLRCSEKLGALSPMGPWDAYTSALRNAQRYVAATNTFTGTNVGITRVRLFPRGNGTLDVWCATAAGVVPGVANDPTTDLGACNAAVQRYATPQAITAVVQSAVAVPFAITYTAVMYNTSGKTEQQIKDTIASAVETFLAAQPVGGNVVAGVGSIYRDAIIATIIGSMPEVFHVVLASPAADVVLTSAQIGTISGGVPTATITQVPPPEGYRPA